MTEFNPTNQFFQKPKSDHYSKKSPKKYKPEYSEGSEDSGKDSEDSKSDSEGSKSESQKSQDEDDNEYKKREDKLRKFLMKKMKEQRKNRENQVDAGSEEEIDDEDPKKGQTVKADDIDWAYEEYKAKIYNERKDEVQYFQIEKLDYKKII